ncbi:MAG TPA: hypothetical protein VK348_11475, partial [Planctomycetota bacterium]|nr:hypothetical protein [Planctomycetota bacterium]
MSVFVIMSVGTATLGVLLAKHAVVKRAVEVDQAYLTAEAGIDLAMGELNNNKDYGVNGIGVVAGTAGKGTFTTTLAPVFAGPGTYTLVSTGHIGGVTRSITVNILQTATAAGFVGLSSITMSGGLIDTYDASLGTYASQVSGTHAGSDAKLKSNGNITLTGSAKVYGDATPGVAGTVSGAAGVTGSTAPESTVMTVPPVVYAPPIASMGAFSATKVFAPGTYRYSTFTVPGGKIATFTGNVVLYVDGNFTISGSGVGIISPGAHLTIYHGAGTFTISGSGVVNQDL